MLWILGDVREILRWLYTPEYLWVSPEYAPNTRIHSARAKFGMLALDFILEHLRTGLAPSIPEYPPSILRIFGAYLEEANPSALRTSQTVPEYTPDYSEPLGPLTYREVWHPCYRPSIPILFGPENPPPHPPRLTGRRFLHSTMILSSIPFFN